MSDLVVTADSGATSGRLMVGDAVFPCALGRAGLIRATEKREGDGGTPLGIWPLRRLFYRPDRLPTPETGLVSVPLTPQHGWCDAPADPAYNRLVTLPYPASHEEMWRQDAVYDLVVELGYNDDPVQPGSGSAIFLHIARDGYLPTEGCVALAEADLLAVLRLCGPESRMIIRRAD
ncbi:MAG: L,D-transpeptidase family protein [Alphaproteobacteria bacterium]|nr:L,D-transpeptidase family protein [Alphaproteobacteria bacterium]